MEHVVTAVRTSRTEAAIVVGPDRRQPEDRRVYRGARSRCNKVVVHGKHYNVCAVSCGAILL